MHGRPRRAVKWRNGIFTHRIGGRTTSSQYRYMSYFVYVLKSKERNYLYVGMTNNLDERLSRHNAGRVNSTKPYKPFDLIYSEECADGLDARKREKYLKSSAGKSFLRIVTN